MILLGGIIISVFWHEEIIYALPTPVPIHYQPLAMGQNVTLPFTIKENNKPIFLHFFNPDCPCSRFNINHFKTLVKEYGDKVNFIVVAQIKDSKYSAEKIKSKFDLDILVLLDTNKKIAESCGVYSTPQAAIINTEGKLYYRGNYNRARYCTDKRSNYAQIAIDSLMKGMRQPDFDLMATRSYGCSLPLCK